MSALTFKWIVKGNAYFSSSWAPIRFQPILYFFMFGAGIRLLHKGTEPHTFEEVLRSDLYGAWLGMVILAPVVALLSWVMIEKLSGRWRFIGMWLRLTSSIGSLTVLTVYHAVIAFHQGDTGETQIFSRYMIGSILIFVCSLLIRDIWTLVITERLAGRIHRGARYDV